MRWALVVAALLPVAAECEQSYRVYTEHPRLWLNARRLRLLKRERERDSIRWQQFQLVSKGKERLPEEPLARALEYRVAGDEKAGRQAVAWALARQDTPDAAELRLLALVFDWCYPLLGEPDKKRLADRMSGASAPGLEGLVSRILAGIALADDWEGSEKALTEAFEDRWGREYLPALRQGRLLGKPKERVAFVELCHAARDNLNLDLWSQAAVFFRSFPVYLLLEYYPTTVTVNGHLFRQPAHPLSEKPDPAVEGELARRTELLVAAYETNSNETQFLQGWITHDIFRLRSETGAVYEYLWMNPYQPGLSYYAAPLYVHDEVGGGLLARSSWDEDAAWIGYRDGELQLFADGKRSPVGTAPVLFPQLAVTRAASDGGFKVRLAEGNDVFVVGLEAGKTYWVKVGEKRYAAHLAGRGGILAFEIESGVETPFEIRTSDPNPAPTLQKKKK